MSFNLRKKSSYSYYLFTCLMQFESIIKLNDLGTRGDLNYGNAAYLFLATFEQNQLLISWRVMIFHLYKFEFCLNDRGSNKRTLIPMHTLSDKRTWFHNARISNYGLTLHVRDEISRKRKISRSNEDNFEFASIFIYKF